MPTYVEVVDKLDHAALIETTVRVGSDEHPLQRRGLHPLVRQQARVELAERATFSAEAHSRRVAWAVAYADQYGGFRPKDPAALARLTVEEPTLWATLTWAVVDGHDRNTIALAHKLEYLYYTHAQWRRNRELYHHLLAAARRLGDVSEIVSALALQIQLLSRQGQPDAAQQELAELVDLSQQTALRDDSFFRSQHAQALAAYAAGELTEAAAAWQAILDQAEARGVSPRLVTGTLHWLAREGLGHNGAQLGEAVLGKGERGASLSIAMGKPQVGLTYRR